MRAHYSEGEIFHMLKNGLRFVSPIYRQPSRGYPFRAIIEAAGVPGVSEGKGKLTRKRFVRLVMSTGNGRREAEYLAWAAHRHGVSYRECLQRTMVPAILRGDAAMETMQANIREINNRHRADQDPDMGAERKKGPGCGWPQAKECAVRNAAGGGERPALSEKNARRRI